jgi:hypothetical protein
MIKKIICLILIFVTSNVAIAQNISSLAAVTMAGGIIKAQHGDGVTKKYPRKDCPVCKGKGWYISGDKISKVDCGYCEPEKSSVGLEPLPTKSIEKTRVYKK